MSRRLGRIIPATQPQAMTDVLDQTKRFWDAHAERDPMWAALSDAGKEERHWVRAPLR